MGVYTDSQNDENSMLDIEEEELLQQEDIIKTEGSTLEPITPNQAAEQKLGDPTNLPIEPEVLPDLTNKAVREQMATDQKIWWDMPRGEERQAARDSWIIKYWGSQKAYTDSKALYGTSNPIESVGNTMQTLAAMGQGLPDQFSNIIGMLPGLAGVDNAYDKLMMKIYDNPNMTTVREVSQIILPSILTGQWVNGLIGKAGYAGYLGKGQQFWAGFGLNTAIDSAIVAVSDQSEGPTWMDAVYNSNFLNVFGKDQILEVPDFLRHYTTNSPFHNRLLHYMADLPVSGIGNLIGWGIEFKKTPSGVPMLGWMEPLDEASSAYKNKQILSNTDSNNILEMDRLNELINSGKLSKAEEAAAIDELILLEEKTGKLIDIEDALRMDEDSIIKESDAAAERKIRKEGRVPDDLDSDIVPETATSSKPPIPPGAVAKNKADIAAIEYGDSVGDPAQVISEQTLRNVGPNDPARKAVVNISRINTGRFDAVVDNFTVTNEQMQSAAWGKYAEIIDPDADVEDLRALFSQTKDIKTLLNGKLQVEYISDENFQAAMLALRDLTDIYTGTNVNETTARIMTTLGKEISSTAEGGFMFKGIADNDQALSKMLDKMLFLLDETALSKKVAGWQLQNKNWLNEVPLENLEEAAQSVLRALNQEASSIHSTNLRYVNTLRKVAEIRPEALKPLSAAFVLSDGKVDTLTKLFKYAANEVSPLTLIKSPDPTKMSMFSKNLFGLVFNNVLSLRSVSRATQSMVYQMTLKPLTAIQGAAFWGIVDGDLFDSLRRTAKYYEPDRHVMKRGLGYSWKMIKKTHQDPTAMMRAYRKDFIFQDDKVNEVVKGVRELWEADGNWGRMYQYDFSNAMRKLSKMKWARYPLTGMTGPDAFAQYFSAHRNARIRAFDDVFSEFGYIKEADYNKAEIAYRRSFFNKQGLLTDKHVQSLSDDVNFTGDDAVSTYINKATNAFPLLRFAFMFPRTESNSIKNAMSWLPISAIPGANKFSKTIYARSEADIAQALMEHGIDFATDPNAMAIFKDLRNEYTGRLLFSAGITKLLWDYSMGGGIIGSGHYDPTMNKYEREVLGIKHKTIAIPGTDIRYSFDGIPILDPLLTIMGNMSHYAKEAEPLMEDWYSKVVTTLVHSFGANNLENLNVVASIALGDWNAVQRFFKRAASAVIVPAEVKQLARSQDNALRNVSDSMLHYFLAQTPFTIGAVPKYIDALTGQPLRDHDNGFTRYLNHFVGIKFSSDNTHDPDKGNPLNITIGKGDNQQTITGTTRELLRMLPVKVFNTIETSEAGVKYTTEQQQKILEEMHRDGTLFPKLRDILSSKKYWDQIGIMMHYYSSDNHVKSTDIELEFKRLPIIQELKSVIKEYKENAEQIIDLEAIVEAQKEVNFELERGNVNEAIDIQKQNTQRQLLQYGGSR